MGGVGSVLGSVEGLDCDHRGGEGAGLGDEEGFFPGRGLLRTDVEPPAGPVRADVPVALRETGPKTVGEMSLCVFPASLFFLPHRLL